MKTKLVALAFGGLAALLLQGCIAFPPLIQVEHKDNPNSASNQEVLKRLDAIDNRLNQLEKNEQQKTEQK